MKHTLTLIGHLGIRKAYLDIPLTEAIKRYEASEGMKAEDTRTSKFSFDDEFNAYDAWENLT